MTLRHLGALVICSLVAIPSAFAVESGRAEGTVTINRKPVKLKYAFAKKEKDSDEKDQWVVMLTDRGVSRSMLADSQRFNKAVENGQVVAVKLEFDAEHKLSQGQVMSKVLQHRSLPMMAGKMKVTSANFTASSVDGNVVTTEDQEFFSDVATLNVKFAAPLGAGDKYGDNPASAKELAASGPRLADGTAKGTLKVDGKTVTLTHVAARRAPNVFHEEKMDTILYITDQELPADGLAHEEKIDSAASAGTIHGLRLKIDEDESPAHLMFLLPDNNMQISGSGIFNFDATDFSDKHVTGRFYTTSEQDFMDKHKFSYDVTFATPVVTIIPPKEFTVDASNGTKLPANGGEPGKAYTAFDKAARSGNLNEMKKLASKTNPMPEMKPEEAKQMVELMKLMRPSKIKILSGYASADHATLTVEGDDPMDKSKAHGTVELAKEDGTWKLLKEQWKN
ncbi:MAG: hypothetical protein ABI837_19065 [Acidobacteriota bacterium]